jgi:hypothetical protein
MNLEAVVWPTYINPSTVHHTKIELRKSDTSERLKFEEFVDIKGSVLFFSVI